MRVVGDGALVASLARATGTGMRDIVATIQREQDEAIRSPAGGVTLVRGGPGTGKTAVALHRAAFLLYSDRQRFAGGGVLVVGPSPVFVNYIARVLPSLGEDEVTLSSLGTLVLDVRATRHDPDDVATIKGSSRMATVLSRAVRDSPPDAPTEFRLLYRGQLLRLDRQALRRLRDSINGIGSPHNAVRRKAAGQLIQALYQQAGELFGPGWKTTREEFAEQVAERSEFIAFMRAVVAGADAGRRAAVARRRGPAAYLCERAARSRGKPRSLAAATSAQTRISVEDVALIDELDELLGSPPKRKRAVEPVRVGWGAGTRDLPRTAGGGETGVRAAGRLSRVRAHRRRRGPGRLADAVAHDRAAGLARELDDRRRPGAVGVARRSDRDPQGSRCRAARA